MDKLAKKRSSWPLGVLLVLTLSSCGSTNTPFAEPQLGSTVCETQAALVNPNMSDSGIGGTGIRVSKNVKNGGEGGIGGTGVIADSNKAVFGNGGVGGTGIVGVITGFASICVNGIEVNYDATTPVWENGKASTISQLAVGQVVSVSAVENGPLVTARGIGVIQAVVGPVSAINAATGELRVVGQKIEASRINLDQLKIGDWLRISGHSLASGEVIPSHIQPISSPINMLAQVRGNARNLTGKAVMLGDTHVNLSGVSKTTAFDSGDELWVSGSWHGQQLQAIEVVVNPTLQGLGRVEKIVFEGYIHSSSSSKLNLGNRTLVLSNRTQIVGGSSKELQVNRRVQVTGHLDADKSIAVDRIEFSRQTRRGSSGKSSNSQKDSADQKDDRNLIKTRSDDSSSGNSGSGSSGSKSGSSDSGGSDDSDSGSSGSGSSGSSSGSSSSGSSGSGSSGSGSSGSGSSGSSSGGSGSSGKSSSGSGSSGSGSSGSGSSGSNSGSSGKGSSGSGKSSSK
jgi:Domain of unknown function (DUF5666)